MKYLSKFKLACSLKDKRRFCHKRKKNYYEKISYSHDSTQYLSHNSLNKTKSKKSQNDVTHSRPIATVNIMAKNIPRTTIINIKGKKHIYGSSLENDPNMVYCGRLNNLAGWNLPQSKWANPFKVTKKEDNKRVCDKYEKYLRDNPFLLKRLKELIGKKLACWCYPLPCHTEVLIKLLKEYKYI